MPDLSAGCFARPDLGALARHGDVFGANDEERVLRLADALASGPLWSALSARLRIAVRTEPAPIIAVLGTPGDADGPALDALGWQVQDSLDRLLPIGWEQAVALTERLAERLTNELGDRLAGATLVGVPRGGLIVAGLLSYALDRPAGREHAVQPPGRRGLVVAVDDCAVSGARLRRWLEERPEEHLVVAHLHSHPALRDAVAADDRVIACIAAADLEDHAPTRHGKNHGAWVSRWQERSPDDFWTGHPDHVVYPWNEPDVLFWDTVGASVLPGWRVVPPQWCLKNRFSADPRTGPQWCKAVEGPILPGPEVLWCSLDDQTVVVADAGTGRALTLSGVGADLWSAIVATGDAAQAAADVATSYDVPFERVRGDLDEFVRQCREVGLLAR